MYGKPQAVRAQLEQWRAQQHDRHDRLGFALIEAMQTRAEGHDGAVRRVLDARLAVLLEAYAAQIAQAGAAQPVATADTATPLAGLLAALAQRERTTPQHAPASDSSDAEAGVFPALPAVTEFRDLWTKVRNESQQRVSLAQGPGDGGPLNSAVLVHRSLTLMSELAPGYLQHFLMYLDNLAWLEQLQPATAPSTKDAPRTRSGTPRRPRTTR